MPEHDSLIDAASAGTDDRSADLTAAAEAARTWVRERCATWSDQGPVGSVPARPPAVAPAAPGPVAPTAVDPIIEQLEWTDEHESTDESDAGERPGARRWQMKTVAVSSRVSLKRLAIAVWKGLGRWSRQLTVVTTLAVVVTGLGWTARAYWRQRAAAPRTGTTVLQSVPDGSEVIVDGVLIGVTPVARELLPGRHLVEFRRRNATRTLSIEVVAGQSTLGRLDWNARQTGRLQVESEPQGAKVIVDGRDRGVTPLVVDDLTEGPHAVVLQSADGSVRRTVAIAAGQTAHMSEAIYAGWLHVSSPIELAISEDGRPLSLDDREQILLPPGSHALDLENRALGYRETRQIVIRPGELTHVSVAPPRSTLTVTSATPVEVVIDGERAGDTPLINRPVALGTHDIVVKATPGGAERRFTITVTSAPARLDVDLSRP